MTVRTPVQQNCAGPSRGVFVKCVAIIFHALNLQTGQPGSKVVFGLGLRALLCILSLVPNPIESLDDALPLRASSFEPFGDKIYCYFSGRASLTPPRM